MKAKNPATPARICRIFCGPSIPSSAAAAPGGEAYRPPSAPAAAADRSMRCSSTSRVIR